MIKILNHNDIDTHEWQQLVNQSATASYFQTKECYDFYSSLSFLKPFLYGVSENGELKGLVCGYIISNGGKIKQYFSRRAVIQGGLLLAKDVSTEAVTELLGSLRESLAQKVIYIEIRNCCDFENYKTAFLQNGFTYHSHLNYLIDTSKPELVKNRYSESKVRQVRKAGEQGVVCELTKNQVDIDDFYKILSDLYKRKVKKPLFPQEFFNKFVGQPSCYLFVVRKDNIVIGGIACAALSSRAVYEWFVCGDTKNYNHLYPSVAATHQGIKFAAENGFIHFDFMGAGKPDVDYGVRDFKEKFGGELYEHGRFRYVSNKKLFNIGKFVVEKLKILKF